jgi:hypothetical protein
MTVAVVIVALVVAAFAEAGQQTVTPRQFTALSKRVTKLEKDDNALAGYIGTCLANWAPVSEYGGLNNEGYAYQYADGKVGLETALDLSGAGETPSFYVPAPKQNCSLQAYRKLAARVGNLPQPRILRATHHSR